MKRLIFFQQRQRHYYRLISDGSEHLAKKRRWAVQSSAALGQKYEPSFALLSKTCFQSVTETLLAISQIRSVTGISIDVFFIGTVLKSKR